MRMGIAACRKWDDLLLATTRRADTVPGPQYIRMQLAMYVQRYIRMYRRRERQGHCFARVLHVLLLDTLRRFA